jgi:AGZA family xanthine/uracil permease-like MFS transporter
VSGSVVRREVLAGLTTFSTLSYILFVQPVVLSMAGMDPGAVLGATCVASAAACFLMGLWARLPVALAPGMGSNFFFSFTLCGTAAGGLGLTWQQGLAAVFVAGVLFLVLGLVRFRETVLEAIPQNLRSGIGAGIGLLIAMVGLEWSGIVVPAPGTYVALGDLSATPTLVSLAGLVVALAGMARRWPFALLASIVTGAVLAVATGTVTIDRVVSPPPSLAPTLFALDLPGLFTHSGFVSAILVLLFLDLFDTVGTLMGVARAGDLMVDGRLPRAGRALASDAVGTIAGALAGTSTVTSYVESAAGVQAGGRTGLTAVTVGVLFLLSLFLTPLIHAVGGSVALGDLVLYPVVAPALIAVGSFMVRELGHVEWKDPARAIPAFLTAIMMPVTFSITEGIAFGFITHVVLMAAAGRAREVHPVLAVCAAAFLARYLFLV